MRNDAAETFDVDGVRVHIYYDQDAESPRTDCDNAGTMVCSHRRYNLGDREPTQGELDASRHGGFEGLIKHLERQHGGPVVLLRLGLYDHSGITMYVVGGGGHPCPWDSGDVGFIYADGPTIQEEWGGDVEAAEKYLRATVETYDEFLTGQVYGYVVSTIDPEADEDDDSEGEHLDSCWGFYGLDYCKEEATSQAKYHAERIAKERADKEATELAFMVA